MWWINCLDTEFGSILSHVVHECYVFILLSSISPQSMKLSYLITNLGYIESNINPKLSHLLQSVTFKTNETICIYKCHDVKQMRLFVRSIL